MAINTSQVANYVYYNFEGKWGEDSRTPTTFHLLNYLAQTPSFVPLPNPTLFCSVPVLLEHLKKGDDVDIDILFAVLNSKSDMLK